MTSSDSITLVEKDKIITHPSDIAETFGSFFSNAVKNLNIKMHEKTFKDDVFPTDFDLISEAIRKYESSFHLENQ